VKLGLRSGGRGTITFSIGDYGWMNRRGPSLAGLPQYELAFILVDEAEHIHALAAQAIDEAG